MLKNIVTQPVDAERRWIGFAARIEDQVYAFAGRDVVN
jgi:hypothetical protein